MIGEKQKGKLGRNITQYRVKLFYKRKTPSIFYENGRRPQIEKYFILFGRWKATKFSLNGPLSKYYVPISIVCLIFVSDPAWNVGWTKDSIWSLVCLIDWLSVCLCKFQDLWLVDAVHKGYLTSAQIGQNPEAWLTPGFVYKCTIVQHICTAL